MVDNCPILPVLFSVRNRDIVICPAPNTGFVTAPCGSNPLTNSVYGQMCNSRTQYVDGCTGGDGGGAVTFDQVSVLGGGMTVTGNTSFVLPDAGVYVANFSVNIRQRDIPGGSYGLVRNYNTPNEEFIGCSTAVDLATRPGVLPNGLFYLDHTREVLFRAEAGDTVSLVNNTITRSLLPNTEVRPLTVVQSVTGTGTNTATVTVPNVQEGNTLVAFLGNNFSGSFVSGSLIVTDNRGQIVLQGPNQPNTPVTVSLFIIESALGGDTTITATSTNVGTTQLVLQVFEIQGAYSLQTVEVSGGTAFIANTGSFQVTSTLFNPLPVPVICLQGAIAGAVGGTGGTQITFAPGTTGQPAVPVQTVNNTAFAFTVGLFQGVVVPPGIISLTGNTPFQVRVAARTLCLIPQPYCTNGTNASLDIFKIA